MPIQAPQWTEFLSCPICYHIFDEASHRPISLGCGHTVCKLCLTQLPQKKCPFDQTLIVRSINDLPVNFALLQLVGVAIPDLQDSLPTAQDDLADNLHHYNAAKKCIEELAIFLKPLPQVSNATHVSQSSCVSASSSATTGNSPFLSRPMQRKLVALVNCQLIEEEGRARAVKAARSLGERTVTEMILLHQNPQQLSANLWAGVRARGCQFLGPAMQEEVLKLILLALEDGSALSRKVLVLFVVQRLENQYPQASKTAIGHVVQLLYRASCFKVTKREEESSLMQLKEEFRSYEMLRREHDSQIVQIATEAGLRISPEQWSSLLYGDTAHKSHMQSIIDKLQTPQSFGQSINELSLALQRTGDPGNLAVLRQHLDLLASVDPCSDNPWESWEALEHIIRGALYVVKGLIDFTTVRSRKGLPPDMSSMVSPSPTAGPLPNHPKYKTSMCRDLTLRGQCPRGNSCTFAHAHEEMEKFRSRSKTLHPGMVPTSSMGLLVKKVPTSGALTPKEKQELAHVSHVTQSKLAARQAMVSQAQMKGETTTVSDNPKPIMSCPQPDSPREATEGITVPVAKPSLLLGSTKQLLMKKESIYSSHTLIAKHSHVPNVMPISQRVPTQPRGQPRATPRPQPSPQPTPQQASASMGGGRHRPQGNTMPQGGSEMPQGGSGMPQDGRGMPQGGSGMHQDRSGMPQDRSGMPQDGSRMPQSGRGMPHGGRGMPHGGSGMPQGGRGMPHGGSVMPQDGRGMLQDGRGMPQGGSGGGMMVISTRQEMYVRSPQPEQQQPQQQQPRHQPPAQQQPPAVQQPVPQHIHQSAEQPTPPQQQMDASRHSVSPHAASPPHDDVREVMMLEGEQAAMLRSAVSMPPNPYTASAPAIAICNYGTQKPPCASSPSEQLGDLQKRRHELLHRLNMTNGKVVTSTSTVNSSSPTQPHTTTAAGHIGFSQHSQQQHTSVQQKARSLSPAICTTSAIGGELGRKAVMLPEYAEKKMMSMSVADSMAMSHSVMSLAQCQHNNHATEAAAEAQNMEELDIDVDVVGYQFYTSLSSPSGKSDDSYGAGSYQLFSDTGGGGGGGGDWACIPEDTREDHMAMEDFAPIVDDQGDEFVPFEHTTVSKYGPISRRGFKDKLKYMSPVNVTAGQPRAPVPVMAVTPNLRPFPSVISQGSVPPDPRGICIASSLPTAMLKPNVIAAGTNTATLQMPHTLWALQEKMLINMSDNCTHPIAEQNQIHEELVCVSQKIKSLQLSEEERLSRELQAIELNIQETCRHVSDNREQRDFLIAREEQNIEVAKEQEKKVQEAQDRLMAERIALEEAKKAIHETEEQ